MKIARFFVLLALTSGHLMAGEVSEQARELAQSALIVDSHIDVPYRIQSQWEDVTGPTVDGDFDYPRAVSGGLNVPFMSIYTPSALETEGGSYQLANLLIDGVEALQARAPGKFVVVSTPEDAKKAQASGRIALAMGMENGSPIEGKLENVGYFRDRGISYITLTHALANHISDSSYDPERPNGGLSPFGREVIAAMNDAGVMVDISHVSDDAFWQALETSRVPMIASHSSARHFTPEFERNMSDEMISALGAKGGVIMINFGSSFLTARAQQWTMKFSLDQKAWLEANGFEEDSDEAKANAEEYRQESPFPFADMADVLNHFDHIIALAGPDSVGIGSDYDGVGDSLPVGLKDVAAYPALVEGLLGRGHSPEVIKGILGGNLVRVWGLVVSGATAE